MSLLLTLNYFTPYSRNSIVNLEQVNADWETLQEIKKILPETLANLINLSFTLGVLMTVFFKKKRITT